MLRGWAKGTGRLLSEETHPRLGKLVGGLAFLVLPAVVMVLFLQGGSVAVQERGSQPFYRVDAAAWLAQNVPPGSPIMVRDTEIPLYAGLPQVAFPNAAWEQVTAYARARGARYLVIDDKEIKTIRPELAPLLESGATEPLPGLTPLAQLQGGGRTTLIFALH